MAAWRPTPAACAVLVAGLLGCTRVSDEQRFDVDPEPLTIVRTVPAAGADAVGLDAVLDLCFSHRVDPRSVAATDATMSSGPSAFDTELALQLEPWRGPGGAPAGDAPWCEGSVLSVTPKAELQPGLRYRVRVVPRMRGWDGEALDTTTPGWIDEGDVVRYYLEFRTAADADEGDTDTTTGGDDPQDAPAPTLADLFRDGRVFDPARATCSCHRDPDALALQRLDLRSVDAAWSALVLDTRERETGFPLVSQRRPSESFLVHKLLRDEHGAPLQHLLGDAMPPDEPVPYADYVDVARWIEAGAPRQ
ncbi:MAG: Ig-like domain-containing protein [Nannocystaceae bacterium]|nr:Ig-like domain-containing protein [Nannocystaceae bacterium]